MTGSRVLFSVSLLATVLFLTLSLGTAAQVHALYQPIAMGGIIVWPRNAVGMMALGSGSRASVGGGFRPLPQGLAAPDGRSGPKH